VSRKALPSGVLSRRVTSRGTRRRIQLSLFILPSRRRFPVIPSVRVDGSVRIFCSSALELPAPHPSRFPGKRGLYIYALMMSGPVSEGVIA